MAIFNPTRGIEGGRVDRELAERQREENINRAYERAVKVLRHDAIKPGEFMDEEGFDPDQINLNLDYVREVEKNFGGRKESLILEAIIHDHGEKSNWFGENAFTIKTSDYDDIRHGVDEIVEFQSADPDEPKLALAIDVTFGAKTIEKLTRIKHEIHDGRLAQIDYFISLIDNRKQKLTQVPHFVVETTRETVGDLAQLYADKSKNRELAGHGFQYVMLYQIREQLLVFAAYAAKLKLTAIEEIYVQALENIDRIILNKEQENPDAAKYADAGDVQELRLSLRQVYREITDEDLGVAA